MVQKLQTYGFLWKKKVEEFTPEKIDELVRKDKKGYLPEVDWCILKSFMKVIISCHF